MRRAAKVDTTQRLIVEALRRVGAKVYYIKEPLDLLVGFRGRNVILECKTPGEKPSQAQREFIDGWPGEVYVVYTPNEAIARVTGLQL